MIQQLSKKPLDICNLIALKDEDMTTADVPIVPSADNTSIPKFGSLNSSSSSKVRLICGRDITSTIRKQIVILNQEGFTGYQIAKKLNMKSESVYSILKRLKEKGVDAAVNPKGQRHSVETVKSVIELYEKGLKPGAIGEFLNLKPSSVSNMLSTLRLRGANYLLEARQQFHSPELKSKVIELFEKGHSRAQISEITKIPLVTIHTLLRKYEALGLDSATSSNRISPEMIDKIAYYRSVKFTYKKIGEVLGITERQVKDLTYKHKLLSRTRKNSPEAKQLQPQVQKIEAFCQKEDSAIFLDYNDDELEAAFILSGNTTQAQRETSML